MKIFPYSLQKYSSTLTPPRFKRVAAFDSTITVNFTLAVSPVEKMGQQVRVSLKFPFKDGEFN